MTNTILCLQPDNFKRLSEVWSCIFILVYKLQTNWTFATTCIKLSVSHSAKNVKKSPLLEKEQINLVNIKNSREASSWTYTRYLSSGLFFSTFIKLINVWSKWHKIWDDKLPPESLSKQYNVTLYTPAISQRKINISSWTKRWLA